MCGIVGFIHPQEHPDQILRRMMTSIAYRGPDDRGEFIDQNVCLGHVRLSIIDLETGHQPMANADQSVWVIYNGEIYNYRELRSELAARGHRFISKSDTEVLLHLYDVYGDHCVDYLNGMFAFIIYDRRRHRLFAARDRFGIKPFYYTMPNNGLVFASEIKALLQHPTVCARVDRRALAEYVTLQFCLGSKTLFEGIKKLEPASCLSFDLTNGKHRLWEYWRPTSEHDPMISEASAVEQLDTLLRDSIRLQLRSDVALGTSLSGGLDSSVVTCLAADLSPRPIMTFTGGFREQGPYDESAFAKVVVGSRNNLLYREVYPSSSDFIDALPKLIYHMDEPAAGPGIFPQYMVSSLASKHVKVVLGGQGGDELFGGYARYYLLHLWQRISESLFHPTRADPQDLLMLWKKRKLLRAYLPSIKRLFSKRQWGESWATRYLRLLNRSEKSNMYFTPDIVEPSYRADMEQELEALFNRFPNSSLYERATFLDMKTHLPALLQVEDRVSMAVSLESRVPLLDHRIVELMGRLSSDIKYKHGNMKHLYKKSASKIVPAAVVQREDKMGFPVPLVTWAKGPLQPFLKELFTSAPSRQRGVFNNDHILQALGQEHTFGRDLWGALCLEIWFKTFIDRNPKEEL